MKGADGSVKAGTSVAATAGSEEADFEYDDDDNMAGGSDDEDAKMYEDLQVRAAGTGKGVMANGQHVLVTGQIAGGWCSASHRCAEASQTVWGRWG